MSFLEGIYKCWKGFLWLLRRVFVYILFWAVYCQWFGSVDDQKKALTLWLISGVWFFIVCLGLNIYHRIEWTAERDDGFFEFIGDWIGLYLIVIQSWKELLDEAFGLEVGYWGP